MKWILWNAMPIQIVEVAHERGLIYVYSGHVDGEESIESVRIMTKHPEKLKQLYFSVTDLTKAESLNLSQQDIQMIVEVDRTINIHLQPGFVIAIIAVQDIHFGLARMWQAYVES